MAKQPKAVVEGQWGDGEEWLLDVIWPKDITLGGDDILAVTATLPLILFGVRQGVARRDAA